MTDAVPETLPDFVAVFRDSQNPNHWGEDVTFTLGAQPMVLITPDYPEADDGVATLRVDVTDWSAAEAADVLYALADALRNQASEDPAN